MSAVFDWDRFRDCPIIGILRGFDNDAVREMVRAACAGGLANIEITMNSPNAEDSIRVAIETVGDRANVGAGTVCSPDDLERALEAGASFIVTPVLVPEVVRICVDRKIPVIPGALSPTEIHTAWSLGADLVKVFPANHFGPRYLKDIKGPLPQIKIMPTGGIDATTIGAFRQAGADAFGVGGGLFAAAGAEDRDWGAIESEARRLVDAYHTSS